MEKDTATKIERLLKKYADDRKQLLERQAKVATAREAFAAEFSRIRVECIRPTMEDLGAAIKKGGHDYDILDNDKKITMRVFRDGRERWRNNTFGVPQISFTGLTEDRQVLLSPEGDMAKASEKPKRFRLEEITTATVEKEISDVLDRIFDPRLE